MKYLSCKVIFKKVLCDYWKVLRSHWLFEIISARIHAVICSKS